MKRFLVAICFMLATSSVVARGVLTDAYILAGIGQPQVSKSMEATWLKHQQEMVPQWVKLHRERFSVMQDWSEAHLKADNCKTMLYPFSGPDFFNAYALFPNCDTYVFFGLEKATSMPEMQKLSSVKLTIMLYEFRRAMTDIIQRNYFITKQMFEQLRTFQLDGVTPIIAAEMAAYSIEIKSIEHVKGSRMVKIVFLSPFTAKEQTLLYYSLDATNAGLKKYNPDFLNIVRQTKPSHTLLKSASYLLHDPQFTDIRDVIIDTTTVLVQDDTGIPFRFLNSRTWKVKMYGQYDKPISDFNYGYQPDLERAYKVSPNVQPLPFPFGYHWQTGKSGLIVARKIK